MSAIASSGALSAARVAGLMPGHERRVAGDISGEDGGKTPLISHKEPLAARLATIFKSNFPTTHSSTETFLSAFQARVI